MSRYTASLSTQNAVQGDQTAKGVVQQRRTPANQGPRVCAKARQAAKETIALKQWKSAADRLPIATGLPALLIGTIFLQIRLVGEIAAHSRIQKRKAPREKRLGKRWLAVASVAIVSAKRKVSPIRLNSIEIVCSPVGVTAIPCPWAIPT